MSVVEAASVGIKTMADDTLRLTVDIEPRFAKAAFELFGQRGTPMALAALKTGQGITEPEETPPEPAKRTAGPICQWLAMRCKEAPFQEWVGRQTGLGPAIGEQRVIEWVRETCGVESRADIDGDLRAEARFDTRIRRPWAARNKETA